MQFCYVLVIIYLCTSFPVPSQLEQTIHDGNHGTIMYRYMCKDKHILHTNTKKSIQLVPYNHVMSQIEYIYQIKKLETTVLGGGSGKYGCILLGLETFPSTMLKKKTRRPGTTFAGKGFQVYYEY